MLEDLVYADFHRIPSLVRKIIMNQITISISQITIQMSQKQECNFEPLF